METSHYRDHVTETRPLTPPLRAHTPIDESTARDALARTAAALLSTVQSSENQRTRTRNATSQQDEVHQTGIGDKFAQSSFMDLMRRLRDGEVAVEGDKVVEQVQPYTSQSKGKARDDGWANDFAATTTREEEGRVNQGAPPILGPGVRIEDHARAQQAWANRQVDSLDLRRQVEQSYDTMQGLWEEEDQVRQQREREKGKGKDTFERPLQFQGDGGAMVDDEAPQYDTRVHLAQSSWEEDFDDASMIVGGHSLGGVQPRRKSLSAQQKEWDLLQDSWDEFEVTASGLKPKEATTQQQASTSSTAHGYSFAQNNPYLLHQRETAFSSTHHHSHHSHHSHLASSPADAAALSSARIDSLLQHEADVQTDPKNAAAWFSLGLKQQENEREELAISALQRAIELDPTVSRGAAHLALAISYTNESRRGAAYEQIDQWVNVVARAEGSENKVYANEIAQYRNLFGQSLPQTSTERHQYLTGLLIRLAQSGSESMIEGGVDADVQVAMGVLFNSSEEYEKAGDCFEAALAVRPDVRRFSAVLIFSRILSATCLPPAGSFVVQPSRSYLRQLGQDGARDSILPRRARPAAGLRSCSIQSRGRQHEPRGTSPLAIPFTLTSHPGTES